MTADVRSGGAGTARDRRASETRDRIADAALRLFAEHGFAATSTRRIAQAAGVSEALIYFHFGTKAELLRTIPERRAIFATSVEELLASRYDQPVDEFLAAVMNGFVDLVYDEIHFVNMMVAESRTNPELFDLFSGLIERTAVRLASYLDSRVDVGELRPGLPTLAAAQNLFGSLLLFILTNRADDADDLRNRSRRYADDILGLWLHGALAETPHSIR